MKALVYGGPGKKSWQDKEKPLLLHPSDAVVRISQTTICGTDLHILKGDVPAVEKGRILGHEGVGVIEEVGQGVQDFKKGDRCLISCITSCGRCAPCKSEMYSHCENGGWILGHLIDGTQAEYVRIPFADTSLYHIPEGVDEAPLVTLSDTFPTGFEVGVLNGKVALGKKVAIVGAGPIGIAALLTAKLFSPEAIYLIDRDPFRLELARSFGATDTVDAGARDPVAAIREWTGKGVDVAIEAVGTPATFDICQSILAPGGRLAVVGVFGESVTLRLEKLWIENVTLTTGLVDTRTIPLLLRMVLAGRLDAGKLITHRFPLDRIEQAYETFSQAAREKALKIVLQK
ncbi:MAG TPA: zinc-dependent alcohol dehydrogenase family protein [Chroococcales cyanobacterium]|jgi:alcohol dehydrogenase